MIPIALLAGRLCDAGVGAVIFTRLVPETRSAGTDEREGTGTAAIAEADACE